MIGTHHLFYKTYHQWCYSLCHSGNLRDLYETRYAFANWLDRLKFKELAQWHTAWAELKMLPIVLTKAERCALQIPKAKYAREFIHQVVHSMTRGPWEKHRGELLRLLGKERGNTFLSKVGEAWQSSEDLLINVGHDFGFESACMLPGNKVYEKILQTPKSILFNC